MQWDRSGAAVREGEAELLASAHRRSLEVALELEARTVAFPAISMRRLRLSARACGVSCGSSRAATTTRFDEIRFVFRDEDVRHAFEQAASRDRGCEGVRSLAMLGEVLTAIVTPFRADGSVDLERFRALASHLVDNGSDGLVVTGTTGESPTLSDDERFALYEAAIDEVGDRATVVAGTGTYSTDHSVHLTARAHELGVHGFLVVTPYYNKPPVRGIVEHFKAVAAVSDRPIVVYNIPGRVVLNLETEAIAQLAEIETVRAVKQANPDLEQAETHRRAGARPLRGRRRPRLPVPGARWPGRRLRPHPRRRVAGQRAGDALPRR